MTKAADKIGSWRRRLLIAAFWVGLAALMWTLDTLTQIEVLDRLGYDYRLDLLVVSQLTSAIGVLVMVPFVVWLLDHFPIRRGAVWQTFLAHVGGSVVFSLGHYAVMIGLRKMGYPLFGANYGDPASLIGNLVFEYQKDIKIYLTVVIIVTVYRQFLGGEKRLHLRPRSKQKMLVQTGSGESIVSYDEIDFLEAARNYVVVHARGREFLVRDTMSNLLDRLDDAQFARSHRSYAVNLDKVSEIVSVDGGQVLRLADGADVPLSRSYRDEFRQRLLQ